MATEKTLAFYDRPEAERIAITTAAIAERRTVLERWVVLGPEEADPWLGRAALAAAWLQDDAGVADFGCGTMSLERCLRPGQGYVPIDVVARDARTIVCDLNREAPPATPVRAAACLGLIEYLHDPAAFMTALGRLYRRAVVSYNVADAPKAPPERRAHAWVNNFDAAGLEALFQAAGWSILEARTVDDVQRLWRLEARGIGPA